METISVRVLFFAALRELVDNAELWVAMPCGASVAELLSCLKSVYPEAQDLFSVAKVAVNRTLTEISCPLGDGDEVALILPVSGG